MSETAASQAQARNFDEKTFLQAITKFVVADDQVCLYLLVRTHYAYVSSFKSLNVVECPEFRDLLLSIGGELKEAQIPHRTKLRQLIILAWKDYFVELRRELAVCALPFL